MQRPPDKRMPATWGRDGHSETSICLQALDDQNPTILDRQAQRVRARFGLSWPAARAVAEIAFSTARPA